MDSTLMRQGYLYMYMLLALPMMPFGYELRSSIYHGAPGRKLQPEHVIDILTALSTEHCAVKCGFRDGCASVSFEHGTCICTMSYLTKVGVPLYTDVDDDWQSYSKDVWFLAFRAPKEIGGDVYESFAAGVDVTTNLADCFDLTSTACQENYRHPILDSWDNASITKVRLSYYKDLVEAAYVVFNATGSNVTSWFTRERILESTWTNSSTDNYSQFTMEGPIFNDRPIRRFMMSLAAGGCHLDQLYTSTILGTHIFCGYESQTSYPHFIYATTPTPGYPNRGDSGIASADFMAIFLRS